MRKILNQSGYKEESDSKNKINSLIFFAIYVKLYKSNS